MRDKGSEGEKDKNEAQNDLMRQCNDGLKPRNLLFCI